MLFVHSVKCAKQPSITDRSDVIFICKQGMAKLSHLNHASPNSRPNHNTIDVKKKFSTDDKYDR